MVQTEKFSANTQYDDWTGTSAADDYLKDNIQKWLKDRRKLGDHDSVCGLEIYIVEKDYHISVLIEEGQNDERTPAHQGDGVPLPIKRLNLKISLIDFLNKFKQFSVKLSFQGCLTGKAIEIASTED